MNNVFYAKTKLFKEEKQMKTQKNAKSKRLLALLLAVVMIAGIIPVASLQAFAADKGGEDKAAELINAASELEGSLPEWNFKSPIWEPVSSKLNNDLRFDALKHVLTSDGERFTRLEADISVTDDRDYHIEVKGKMVLDLNGHTLKFKLGSGAGYNDRKTAISIKAGATLMVIDSKGGGKILGDTWICAPEDMEYLRAATDVFKNYGTLIINIPDGTIETGRSKQQWVSYASKNGHRDALGNYCGYIRGQANGSAIIGAAGSTTVLVQGKVVGRGFYAYGTTSWSSEQYDETPQHCNAVKTNGKFIMYGGELHGLGGAELLSCEKGKTVIYSGYFRAKSLDKMAIKKHEAGVGWWLANYTTHCGYGSTTRGVQYAVDGAEVISGDYDTTIRPKSVTDAPSDNVKIINSRNSTVLDIEKDNKWLISVDYTPYFSQTARNYLGDGFYGKNGYDMNSGTYWEAKADFEVLKFDKVVGSFTTTRCVGNRFSIDVFNCVDKKGNPIELEKMSPYTLRCTVTERWGGTPEQTRTSYSELDFSLWDSKTKDVASKLTFDFTPKHTAPGKPTNYIVSLNSAYVDGIANSNISKMSVSYRYYVPTTDKDGKVSGFTKKSGGLLADQVRVLGHDGEKWIPNRDVVLDPEAAGPIEVTIELLTLTGVPVTTKTYNIFAMPAITARFLTGEKYTVPSDGYNLQPQFPAWKASMNHGLTGFDKLTDYSLNADDVVWQYYDRAAKQFVDITESTELFNFVEDNYLSTNRTGEYRASYTFNGTRYYSPRSIFLIATDYSTAKSYKAYISGSGIYEFGDGVKLTVERNSDADWASTTIREYKLELVGTPDGTTPYRYSDTNQTGEFNIESYFFKSGTTAENVVPGEYIFRGSIKYYNKLTSAVNTAFSERYRVTYVKKNTGYVFTVNGIEAERLPSDGNGLFVNLPDDDVIFKVGYGVYPKNSTADTYPTDKYDHKLENLTTDIISLTEDGTATVLSPGEAKIRLNVIDKTTGKVAYTQTLTVTIPIVGFEVEEPDYNSYLGKSWSSVKAVVKSVWGPGGRKVYNNTDKYMSVEVKSLTNGIGLSDKVSYNDKTDINWTVQAKSGNHFLLKVLEERYSTTTGKEYITYCADVANIQTNAFTDTVRTAREFGVQEANSGHDYYDRIVGTSECDATNAKFFLSSKDAHVKDPNVKYIDVVSITTGTPAVGDPRYEGTDPNKFYTDTEFMLVNIDTLGDVTTTSGSPVISAKTQISKLGTLTGSGKPYHDASAETLSEHLKVWNYSDKMERLQPTKKYDSGIYANELTLKTNGVTEDGTKYCFSPEVKVFINGHLIEYAQVFYGKHSSEAASSAYITYYFDVGDVSQHTSATVNAEAVTPIAGEKLKNVDSLFVEDNDNLDVTKLVWFVDANGNGKCDSGEEATVENGNLNSDGTIISNKKYSAEIEVGIADGAAGRIAEPFTLKVKYTDLSDTANPVKTVTVSSIKPNGVFTVPYNAVTHFDEKIRKPENGKYTIGTALICHDKWEETLQTGYVLNGYGFKNIDGSKVSEMDLIPGKQYRFTAKFRPQDQCVFVTENFTVKLDGEILGTTESGTKPWAEVSSECVTIHCYLTVPSSGTPDKPSDKPTEEPKDYKIEIKTNAHIKLKNGYVITDTSVSKSALVAASNATKLVRADGKDLDAKTGIITGSKLVLIVSGKTVANKSVVLLGDVNEDGDVSVADARAALRAAVKLDTLTVVQTLAADVNFSNDVMVDDARAILRAAVKLDSSDSWIANLK